jgi:hypothetical protein
VTRRQKCACRVGREVAHPGPSPDPDEEISTLRLFRGCDSWRLSSHYLPKSRGHVIQWQSIGHGSLPKFTPTRAAFARPGPGVPPFPDVIAPMPPSDSLPPSATALVPLACGLPRCGRWFGAFEAADTCARHGSCVGDGSPALRHPGVSRGEARASQVTGPASAYVPWSNTPPAMVHSSPTPRRSPCGLQVNQAPGPPGR